LSFSLYVDRLLNSNSEVSEGASLTMSRGRIASIKIGRVPKNEDIVVRKGTLAPALINSHDHLKYTWPAHIGQPPYEDSLEWLPSLYTVAQREFLNRINLSDLYWLGTYKCILSAVATVANHCKRLSGEFLRQFPIRILDQFAREIFVRFDDRAHQMGRGPKEEIELASRRKLPFVVHIAEGLNHGTECEIDLLEGLGGLSDRAVLVHALNLSDQDIGKIRLANASVVWCPVSNRFLFERTARVPDFLNAGINVALGTDSTCTGSEGLLDEMRAATEELHKMSMAKAEEKVFGFVTANAARAFGKSAEIGQITSGASADFLLFETGENDPTIGLLNLRPGDILLLTCAGKWLVGENQFTAKLPCASPSQTEVAIGGLKRDIAGKPLEVLRRVTTASGHDFEFFPLGRTVHEL